MHPLSVSRLPVTPPPPSPSGPLRVGMLGIGVVGSGTYAVLARNKALIRARAGREIRITMVAARNLPRARKIVGPQVEVVGDPLHVVQHPEVDVVVEVIGGCTVARQLVLEAIRHGKHVVTANKALLALHGDEIFDAARRRGVMVCFEGAVAVSIPIVKALREGLTANRIEWVAGILNGTSNFILSRMSENGTRFDEALREAQRLGYAEADPSLDVNGEDAGHKLALLASMAFGMPLRFDAMPVEGIASIQPADMQCAERLGYRVKLLGVARRSDAGIELRVRPALIPRDSLMAGVNGSMNAVMVKGDAAGVTMHYGAGAGSEQTASAVIADLVDVIRNANADPSGFVPALAFHQEAMTALPVLPQEACIGRHYLRIPIHEGEQAISEVLAALTDNGIAADKRLDTCDEDRGRELLMVTQPASEAVVAQAVLGLAALPGVRGAVVKLAVEEIG